jgi:deoxyinosine 3'endonuclease (endonuclease V)
MPGYLAFREVGFFAALVEHLQVLQVVDDDDSE